MNTARNLYNKVLELSDVRFHKANIIIIIIVCKILKYYVKRSYKINDIHKKACVYRKGCKCQ